MEYGIVMEVDWHMLVSVTGPFPCRLVLLVARWPGNED